MRFNSFRNLRSSVLSVAIALAANQAMADPTPVPFKATVVFAETVTFNLVPPCFATGALSGSGVATWMGNVTGTSQDCTNPIGPFSPTASFQFASVNLVLNDASTGEQLTGTYSGTLTYTPDAPHQISGNFVITGGTGRFAGATGGGTMSGYEDIGHILVGRPARGKAVFDGTILFGCQNGDPCATGTAH
jgi:hypothetical protein